MSLSKECQEYHLTPRGWVEGFFKGDALGGSTEVDPPEDRVLTIRCYDELSSVYSKPHFYDRVDWKSEDENLIAQLKKEYGDRPDWFGYKKMKQ
jgi:hypothetical protein